MAVEDGCGRRRHGTRRRGCGPPAGGSRAVADRRRGEAARRECPYWLVGKGGRFVRGRGSITAPGEVAVAVADDGDGTSERVFRARRGIVLAAGTEAAASPIDGLADTPYWTNGTRSRPEPSPRR